MKFVIIDSLHNYFKCISSLAFLYVIYANRAYFFFYKIINYYILECFYLNTCIGCIKLPIVEL